MKVTAICPTYNRRRFIPSAITCFLFQTFLDSELLIVDDGTERIEDLVPDNPRIRYIGLPEDTRLSTGAKRNFCCEKANGSIIVHWDDDDWSAPGRIEDQVSKLESSGKSVLVYYNILYWNEITKSIYRFSPTYAQWRHGATLCYKKSYWQEHPFNDWMVAEDVIFGGVADDAGQLTWSNAKQFMVTRAHEHNTCDTAKQMGSERIPLAKLEEIPPEFFEEKFDASRF